VDYKEEGAATSGGVISVSYCCFFHDR
jgi:hypothetical protein